MIKNLLEKNNNRISYPTRSDSGDIVFSGMKFGMKEVDVCEWGLTKWF